MATASLQRKSSLTSGPHVEPMLGHLLLGKVSAGSGEKTSVQPGWDLIRSCNHSVCVAGKEGGTGSIHIFIHHPLGVIHSYFKSLVCVFLWTPIPVPQYPFRAFPWRPVPPQDPNEASDTISYRVVKPVLSFFLPVFTAQSYFLPLRDSSPGFHPPLAHWKGTSESPRAWLPGSRDLHVAGRLQSCSLWRLAGVAVEKVWLGSRPQEMLWESFWTKCSDANESRREMSLVNPRQDNSHKALVWVWCNLILYSKTTR